MADCTCTPSRETIEQLEAKTFVNAEVSHGAKESDPQSEDAAYADLERAVLRQAVNRDILYYILKECSALRRLGELEASIAAQPSFAQASLSPYHLIRILVEHHGLRRILLDGNDETVDEAALADLTEDEADDLVADEAFETTGAGLKLVENHAPEARLSDLFALKSDRCETYSEILDFCANQTRSYAELTELLR